VTVNLDQQSTSETASPTSDVSLYFAFIPFAVSAIAMTVVSKSTRRLDGTSLLAIMKPGPRLDRAEGASLDARNLDEAGDRVARHPEVVLQRRLPADPPSAP
jgi:hypothetical protein